MGIYDLIIFADGLPKTLVPLIVIVQKAPGNACFSEGVMANTIKRIEVIKRGSTRDCGEKKA